MDGWMYLRPRWCNKGSLSVVTWHCHFKTRLQNSASDCISSSPSLQQAFTITDKNKKRTHKIKVYEKDHKNTLNRHFNWKTDYQELVKVSTNTLECSSWTLSKLEGAILLLPAVWWTAGSKPVITAAQSQVLLILMKYLKGILVLMYQFFFIFKHSKLLNAVNATYYQWLATASCGLDFLKSAQRLSGTSV